MIDTISHEEAVIQHFTEDPELAEIMLDDALSEGDSIEVEKIQRRMSEAKARVSNMGYCALLVDNAEQTAKDGQNLNVVICLVNRALEILKAAVPVGLSS